MLGLALYLLLGIGLVCTNIVNFSPEEKATYETLKKESPGGLVVGLGISIVFWLPILLYGLFFVKRRE